jgi:U3 small nucleolar ribonucleoprotein component
MCSNLVDRSSSYQKLKSESLQICPTYGLQNRFFDIQKFQNRDLGLKTEFEFFLLNN